MLYLSAFGASFGFIFLKAFQQRNVAFDHYRWVIPTSLAMALFEVWVVAAVVRVGYDLILVGSVGLGAGIGALIAMYLHKRFVNKRNP